MCVSLCICEPVSVRRSENCIFLSLDSNRVQVLVLCVCVCLFAWVVRVYFFLNLFLILVIDSKYSPLVPSLESQVLASKLPSVMC